MRLSITILFYVIFLSESFSIYAQSRPDIPNSPCPQIFQYKYNGNDWYGEVILPSPPIQHREVILHILLSLRAATTQNNVGTITIAHSSEEATNRIINRQPLIFHVRFPYRLPIPKLARIVYDEVLVCTGPEEEPNTETVVSRIDLKHVMNTYTTYKPSNINEQYSANQIAQNTSQPVYVAENPFGTTQAQNIYQRPSSMFPPQQQSVSGPPVMLPPPFMMTGFIPTTTTTTQQSERPPVIPQTHILNGNTNDICGTRYAETEVSPFVYGGENTKRGEWPWMVAIYLNKPTGLSFNCGGSLISSKSVITAAHCINTSTKNYRPHEVVLYLGRYSLIDWSEVGSIATNVEEIYVHSDYKRQRDSFDADIAILIMTKRVEFNEFVRPVCIWPEAASIQEVEGKRGTVVGWGKDGTDHIVSNVPKKVDLPIVNAITCVQTSESLSKAVSNRTFCAGTLDGSGPCHGDSGGGLTLYQNNRWTLRGIVSAGLSDANTGACKLVEYVVFTDVSLFSSWIRTYLQF